MPFTFSHPAIVLPLLNNKKKIFSVTGLVIGSIVPDFEAFIFLSQHKPYSHSWPGIFWFDLPLAILFSFIFHWFVRDALIRNLPMALEDKFREYVGFNWLAFFRKHFVMVLFSMLLGIFSHLLWDAFTHLSISNPNSIDSDIHVGRIRLYKLLQYSNSLLGLILIWIFIMKIPGSKPETIHPAQRTDVGKWRYWLWLSAITVAVSAIRIWYRGGIDAIVFVYIIISGLLLGLILTPFVIRHRAQKGHG